MMTMMKVIGMISNLTDSIRYDFINLIISFNFSDSSDASEDSQYESSTILARRIQIKSNGILDSSRLDDDEPFNSRYVSNYLAFAHIHQTLCYFNCFCIK